MDIENKELWDLMQDIKTTLIELKSDFGNFKLGLNDHEARIRNLERKIFYFSGAVGILGFLSGHFLNK